ncbi:deoxyribodipyrimidine photo-lyase [Sphingomonas sp. HHU CXW]|uniref:Deoxyribodipyrimidine photo-lyase n=1 Tax=Sphingomonas hominis TaxID=2741495 RepID=A0ABX2JFD5_9SPHN|nr:deoxyribodipyrimidine photo-lyase [Sphingomonas hominis]
MTSILWFRQDLRLHDQPALLAAIADDDVVPLYILDDETPGDWRIGGAQRWWLHGSLASLDESLRAHGSRLILRRGASEKVLRDVLEESGADRIHALHHFEPWWRKVEQALGDRLHLHDGNHLVHVEDVKTGSGAPFRIYSSFWKALQEHLPPEKPHPAPKTIPAPKNWPPSETLASLDLLPTKPDWSVDFDGEPGEADAQKKAVAFGKRVDRYEQMRNLPAEEGTSLLSPHLHFGEISVRALWHKVGTGEDAVKYQKELAWRDFTSGVTLALPDYGDKNGRPKYDALEWRTGKEAKADLRAWQRGRTGYPIVDAGMRQLWTSGWMHNRLRMITASFLIKHLLIDWREGERWFWDCLVDADYGNNSVNWQWVAGTGIDANMFSRIMAPLTQSEKFNAGDYIRRWVPELADVPDPTIHDPEAAGCKPDAYPSKIIGHREARERALAAAARLR